MEQLRIGGNVRECCAKVLQGMRVHLDGSLPGPACSVKEVKVSPDVAAQLENRARRSYVLAQNVDDVLTPFLTEFVLEVVDRSVSGVLRV